MKYFICVFIPALIQCFIVFLLIVSNQGNGSWVGLLAFYVGLVGIPMTITLNILYLQFGRYTTRLESIAKCFLIALVAPFLVPVLFYLL